MPHSLHPIPFDLSRYLLYPVRSVDSLDSLALWIALSLPMLAALLLYLSRRYHELIALHLCVFYLQIFAYGWLWLWHDTAPKPFWLMLFVGVEMIVYVGVMLGFRLPVGRVTARALETGSPWLWVILVGAAGVAAFLLQHYGAAAFVTETGKASSLGVPRWALDAQALVSVPAWGAFFCVLIGCGNLRWPGLFNLLGALAFFGVQVLFYQGGAAGGFKREVVIFFFVLLLFVPRLRLGWREAVLIAVALPLGFFAWRYYEGIRTNFRSVVFADPSRLNNLDDVFISLITDTSNGAGLEQDLAMRETPLEFLLTLTGHQMTYGVARGAVIGQCIENALPGGIVDKNWRYEDDVVADAFYLPYTGDSATTLFSQVQAEAFPLAALLTPLIYLGLWTLYLWLLKDATGLWKLALIGTLVAEAGGVQYNLSGIIADARALLIFGGLFHGQRLVLKSIRIASMAQHSMEKARVMGTRPALR